jgi:hypothetical protein
VGISLFHLRGRHALGGDQRRPQGNLDLKLLLGPRRGLGEHGQQRQAHGEVLDGFQVGRTLQRLLPGPLPIGDGLRTEPGFGVVLRDQFGLGLDDLGKLRGQHLGNALVILLTGALQQRLIGGILNERGLEAVGGLWWQPPPVRPCRPAALTVS